MRSLHTLGCTLAVSTICLTLTGRSTAAVEPAAQEALARLSMVAPKSQVVESSGRVIQIAGQPLVEGASARESAEAFRLTHARVLGVEAAELSSSPLAAGAPDVQPVMLDPQTGRYKFMLVRYWQQRNGIPVFRAETRVLMRDEPKYPVVLVNSSLRPIGSYIPDQSVLRRVFRPADHVDPKFDRFSPPDLVIYAGAGEAVEAPHLAYSFIAERGGPRSPDHEKWLYLIEPTSGKILHSENLILHAVDGTISGMATTGTKTDACNPEAARGLPYARINVVGGSTGYADFFGVYTVDTGPDPVTLESPVSGYYFFIEDAAGPEETLSTGVTPPGPANILHNAPNTSEAIRAEINAYIEANVVRDFALTYNPAYPVVSTQTDFPIYVNYTGGYCPGNAWYDLSAINFCSSGAGYPNTAYTSVVHHEYGHHLVQMAGSAQDAYGEGMGDSIGMLIADEPMTGWGFFGDCNGWLRSADNTLQYPCSGEIHYCGQLLSGCIWSTRNQLAITNPSTYRQIISNLTVNSILLHTATWQIDASILTDFLTLDDNDGSIGNGTPHRAEICAGFGAHGFTCPPLATGLDVAPVASMTSEGNPGGPFTPATKTYSLNNLNATPLSYAATATQSWISLSNTGGTLAGGATDTVIVTINAAANSLPLGTYTGAVTFTNTTDHVGDTTRTVTLRVGVPTLQYEWNMDTNPGWTTMGQWAWGVPLGGGGQYGLPDPTSGHTGANVYGYNLAGDYPNNMPEMHLTSTPINCNNMSNTILRFWRWLGVEQPIYDHAYVRVSNDGINWTTVWQNPAQITDFIWKFQEFDISAVADHHPTVYLRWTIGTTDVGWQYCGWNIDDVQILGYTPAPTCTDGVANQGEDRIDCGGPCAPCVCTSNAACDDANPCNGAEICNAYGICQVGAFADCNSNGIADSCDITGGTSADCNTNGTPDTCEITAGTGRDCNSNGSLDSCDIAAGTGRDCNSNGIPDSCDISSGTSFDCNGNTIPDSCDIAGGTSPDCNTSAIPDSCEIAAGSSADCNTNGVPDSCEGGNPCPPPYLLLTFTGSTNIPGVGTVQDEDIVSYTPATNTWALYFDGSDVGLSSFAIDALARRSNGELLISLNNHGNVTGLTGGPSGAAVESSDIIRFIPTSLGANTAGAWTFYFDGSDVGLTSDPAENIDALAITSDGRLLISTEGSPTVSGISGAEDEDVLQFTPTSLGSVTAGTWAFYVDGSDVGLGDNNNEEIDGLALTRAGKLLLSTVGNFTVPGVTGANEDILQFTPGTLGANTTGTYLMYLDLSTKGIATGADVSAIEIVEP